MSDAYTVLDSRIPKGAGEGLARAIRNVLRKPAELKAAWRSISARDDLSPKGRAQLLEKEIQSAGATLRRAQRQRDYHASKIAKARDAIKKKALGEPQATDAEWRTFLRSSSVSERTRLVMKNPEARGAALRAPAALSGFDADYFARMLDTAIQESDRGEVAAVEVQEEAQAVHDAAIKMLQVNMLQAPFIVDPTNGNVRSPHSQLELDTYLDKTVKPPQGYALQIEQVEVDPLELP